MPRKLTLVQEAEELRSRIRNLERKVAKRINQGNSSWLISESTSLLRDIQDSLALISEKLRRHESENIRFYT